jgi:uncharacterized membrane protein YeaQ/YmgE (transglycosylase-associated protein family)
MTITGLLLLLLVAAVCGAVGRAIAGGSSGGCLVSIALGFIGAVIGPWLARQVGLREPLVVRVGGETVPVVFSIAGAALFVALVHLLSGRRR